MHVMGNDRFNKQPWIVFRDGKELLRVSAKPDLNKLARDGTLRRDDHFRHKDDPPDHWRTAGADRDIYPYEEPSLAANIDLTPNPLLDDLKKAFERAMKEIDDDAKQMVEAGRDFRAIEVVRENFETIQTLWRLLSHFYVDFQRMEFVLERFGSERLRQLGQKLPIGRTLPNLCHSYEDYEQDTVTIEKRVLDNLKRMNIPTREHWLIKPVVLSEFYFMLDILSVLIEPDFVPFECVDSCDEVNDRYIAADVKRAVWRRDGGKCFECGSREKLEYDHIIPVCKGGSNTERNVQLLCEKCNRTKAAQIG